MEEKKEMNSDIVSRDSAGSNSLCTVLVHLEAGDLLVLGEAPLLSVGLALLDKADSLKYVAAKVLIDLPATKVGLANVRITNMVWSRRGTSGLRYWCSRGGSWSLWWWLSDGVRSFLGVDS